jgi:hypothetical protein
VLVAKVRSFELRFLLGEPVAFKTDGAARQSLDKMAALAGLACEVPL